MVICVCVAHKNGLEYSIQGISRNTMSINVSIYFPASDILTLKIWAQLNPSDGFSAAERPNPITGAPQGQFSFYTPYFINSPGNWVGTWSSNINHSDLTNATMQKIANLQQ